MLKLAAHTSKLILLVLLASGKICAQQLLFREFEGNSMLPSEESYNIIQDKQGYMWIATEEGYCRYSKGELKVFNQHGGIPEKAVYASTMLPDGKLLVGTSKGRFLVYDGRTFKETAFQKQFDKNSANHSERSVSYPFNIACVGKEIYIHSLIYTSVVDEKNHVRFTDVPPEGTSTFLKVDGKPLVLLSYSPREIMKKAVTRVTDQFVIRRPGKPDRRIKLHVAIQASSAQFSHTACAGSTDFVSMYECLVRINADGAVETRMLPSRVLSMKADKAGGLWVGMLKGGLRYYPDVQNLDRWVSAMSNFSVTGICEDQEGGTWCSTLERGVFYCVNKAVTIFPNLTEAGGEMTLMKPLGNRLFLTSSGNSLTIFDPSGRFEKKQLPFGIASRALDIFAHNRNFVFSCQGGTYILDHNLDYTGENIREEAYFTTYFSLPKGAFQYLMTYRYLFSLPHNSNRAKNVFFFRDGTGRCFIFLNDRELIAGGKYFLQIVDISSGKSVMLDNGDLDVTSILRISPTEVAVTTRNRGIFLYDTKLAKLRKLPAKLPTDVVYKIRSDRYGQLWAATNAGIVKLTRHGRSFSCEVYSAKNGFPSNHVGNLEILGKTLYASSNRGLFCFPVDHDFTPRTDNHILLERLKINGVTRELRGNKVDLSYQQNNLQFLFHLTSYQPGVAVKYELFDENGSTSEIVNGRKLALPNLSPGKYRLLINVLNNEGVADKKPWELHITIRPPFWKTWWFYLAIFVLTVMVVVLTAALIVRRIRRSEEFKTGISRQLAEYQMSALQAQMNPHFIFNAINTIQGYILSQNKDEAYNYLTQFSKLIRMVLHHSQEKTVPLDDELEMLNLYIQLEQLRFDHCFDFILEVGEEVETHEAFIPSMVIQPFIENAIWHGIINLKKSRQGVLRLKISQAHDEIFITIEDNGVGRKQAASFKTSAHKSVALSVTRQRVAMFNRQNGHRTDGLEISDLFDADGQPAGTRVEIRIPLQFS